MLGEKFKGQPAMLSGISNKLVLLLVSGALTACGGFNSGGSFGDLQFWWGKGEPLECKTW